MSTKLAGGLLSETRCSPSPWALNCRLAYSLAQPSTCPCCFSEQMSRGSRNGVTAPDDSVSVSKELCSEPIHVSADSNGFSDSRTVSSEGSDRVSVRSLLASKAVEEDEDAETLADFEEILASEVDVEVERLRELTRNGAPSQLRGQVWMFLLGVTKPDRSDEAGLERRISGDYSEFSKTNLDVMKRVRGEVKRYRPEISLFHESGIRGVFERTLSAYLSSHSHLDYSPDMVHLLGPLVYCISNEQDIYSCFEALMARHQNAYAGDRMSHTLAKFMTLFRNLQPALYETFEEEEVEPSSWAAPWLHSLLCRELPFPCVLRLWDTYFSSDEGFDLHPYVCLSILEVCSEQLLEMDSTELLGFIQHLPSQDMNQIISLAYNMQEKVIARNLI